ncbi:MAG: hypothetical protein ACRDVW_08925 [Acidimicrobiales bacterium]
MPVTGAAAFGDPPLGQYPELMDERPLSKARGALEVLLAGLSGRRPAPTSPSGASPEGTQRPPLSDAAKRKAILTIDVVERKVGLAAAGLGGLIALVTTVPYIINPKTKVSQTIAATKHKTCDVAGFVYDKSTKACNGKGTYTLEHWLFECVLLVAFALAIFVCVRIGRRGALGFTCLMAGLAFETQVGILGLPFIAAGGWLLIRAWRVQRFGSPTATKANPTGERRPAQSRTERAPAKPRGKKAAPTGPTPNKRYTPKTAKKKRPAPTTPPAS